MLKNIRIDAKLVLGFLIVVVIFIGAAIILWKSGDVETEDGMVTIGIARWGANSEYTRNIEGFKDGLAENGYVEGENVQFLVENPETDLDQQRKIIESFVAKGVDLIFSITTPGTLVAKDVTGEIPIVFSVNTFPVESGVIDSLESSGNNLVGTRNYVSVERQYSQFERISPNTKVLAFVHREGEPNSVTQYNEMKKLLAKKRIEVIDIAAVDLDDMRSKLSDVIDTVDTTFSACDTLVNAGGEEVVIEISKEYKKPNFACLKGSVLKGALMGNIADFYVIGKISGRQAALILGGAKPSSLLTESPAEDYVIINTKTAEDLGIVIHRYILDDAKELIHN